MSADHWGTPRDPDYVPPETPPAPETPHPPGIIDCPVPGCPAVLSKNALGPHLKMHRNRNDPGTPPPKSPSKSKAAKAARSASTPGRKPKAAKLAVDDIADGVIALLYPNGIPTEHLREVTAWVAATDRLAAAAIALTEIPDEA